MPELIPETWLTSMRPREVPCAGDLRALARGGLLGRGRYLIMLADLLKTDRARFGVVLIERGHEARAARRPARVEKRSAVRRQRTPDLDPLHERGVVLDIAHPVLGQ